MVMQCSLDLGEIRCVLHAMENLGRRGRETTAAVTESAAGRQRAGQLCCSGGRSGLNRVLPGGRRIDRDGREREREST